MAPDPTTHVYAELKRMADALMAGERADHTLGPTALAHEVWLRLQQSRNANTVGHGAFLGIAAQAMRRILTEHARRRTTERRGGGLARTTLSGVAARPQTPELAVDLDLALTELEAIDAELVRLVELRFYGGCSVDEIATAMSASPRTVKRRWRLARAWLQRRIAEDR
jgi:RNA polymerase sigma factor (TIGR02999 family)